MTNTSDVPVKKNNIKLWILTILLILLGTAFALYWFLYLQYYVSTDDAYANGNKITLNPIVPGTVIAFYTDDTDLVLQGQLLVELDRTEYQMQFDKELAKLASVVLKVRQLFDTVEAERAAVESKQAVMKRTAYDFENREKLVGSQAVSQEDFVHSQSDYLVAKLALKQAEEQLQVALAAAGTSPPASHPLIVEQKAKVRLAAYNLAHCSIYAPATGYVAQRSVQVGQSVSRMSNLLAIIPKDYLWVDANFKETQLTWMRIGQPASVRFDIYGSEAEFIGKVIGIASGTGSVFSILPPQNATGNWIKIVQRLPVRISVDPEMVKNFPLRLGLSCDVSVDISNQDLPRLAKVPATKLLGETDIFQLNLQDVDQTIDEIIQRELQSS